MFSNSGYEANIDLPPLPPRRPTKMHVPQSYIKKLRAQDSLQHDLQNALDTIDSHDVLEQINPRK